DLTDYLGLLRQLETQVAWPHVAEKVRVDTPAHYTGLCVADIAAGIFDSATRLDPGTGLVEPTYLTTVAPLVGKSLTGHIASYGVKVLGPTTQLEALPWWPLPGW